jgi:hypothetical protein
MKLPIDKGAWARFSQQKFLGLMVALTRVKSTYKQAGK